MTRRIALAILITAWTTLVVGGVATYLLVRQVLLSELDESIITRAAAVVPDDGGEEGASHPSVLQAIAAGDRFVVKDESNRTIGRSENNPVRAKLARPEVKGRAFAQEASGALLRNLTLRFVVDRDTGRAVTVIYSAQAESFARVQTWLLWIVAAVVLVGSAVSALIVPRVSRRAMRPLHETARRLEQFGERDLGVRLDDARVPPELRPTVQHVNALLDRVQAAFGRQRQFLSDAAHELRTPVAAMRTSIEVAQHKPNADVAGLRQTLAWCLDDAKVLSRLVERLLEQARSESATAYGQADVDLASLLYGAVEQVSARAAREGVTVSADIALPAGLVRTRPDRVRSIAVNLLDNAIEHTPSGGQVELSCRLADGCGAVLAVRDTGVGIAPEFQQKVFEPFFRVDSSRTGSRKDPQGHVGLGLSLVRSHALALGGDVTLASAPGQGSRFEVRFPLKPGAPDVEGGDVRSSVTPTHLTHPAQPAQPARPGTAGHNGPAGPAESISIAHRDLMASGLQMSDERLRMPLIRRPGGLISAVVLVVALLCAAAAPAVAHPENEPASNGEFPVLVRGAVTGDGVATLGGNQLTIVLTVRGRAGAATTTTISGITVQPSGRFIGTGSLSGVSVKVHGRIDPAADGDQVPKFSATLVLLDATGKPADMARVVGGRRGPPTTAMSPPRNDDKGGDRDDKNGKGHDDGHGFGNDDNRTPGKPK